jgi:putative transposase
VITEATEALVAVGLSVVRACDLAGYPRASFYRHHRTTRPARTRPVVPQVDRHQPAALSDAERGDILAVLALPERADLSVGQVFYRHLDTGCYLGSRSTWYRVARDHGQTGDRRRQATARAKKIPELTATAPNQVWSWDITKLKTPIRGQYWHLYVIVDIYSRYVTGWAVHPREGEELAQDLIATACHQNGGGPDYLHSDNGSSMASNAVAGMSHLLGVQLSFSRPKVSNDNPYSEALFKTVKYDLTFPETLDTLDDAQGFCEAFFTAYNDHHRHSGIGYHVPANVHHGRTSAISEVRRAALDRAWREHPERFTTRPRPPRLPDRAHINNPKKTQPLSQAG